MVATVEYRRIWGVPDEATIGDALEFWAESSLLPAGVDAGERARELCIAAYIDARLVAVSTAHLTDFPQLRRRFAFLRCAVHPLARRDDIASTITEVSFQALDAWSKQNPQAAVAGMAVVIESRDLADFAVLPVWTSRIGIDSAGLNLVGYNRRGEQVRVAWFSHARVDPFVDPAAHS